MRATQRPFRFALVIAALSLALLPVCADDKSPEPAKPIAAALQPFVDNHTLAGAVALVADKDKVLSITPVGYADIAGQTLMSADTLFWIASQSKPITAALLMMLVDDGKLMLDDPVEKYLPEFKDLVVETPKKERTKPSHPIKIREILSHTSGLRFQSEEERPTLDVISLRAAALSYTKMPLSSQPGTAWQYSNAGINTAGRIIEVVSGMPFEDFLDKRLLKPLGMKDTTFWPSAGQLKRLAKLYRPTKDQRLEETTTSFLKYPLDDRKRQPVPAGGLFSTATDVAHFCQMVLGGGVYQGKRYLSQKSVKEMTSKQTGNLTADYGLGWTTGSADFGHGGALYTNMTVDPRRGLIYVWMVQHAGAAGDAESSKGAFRKTAEKLYRVDR